MQVSELDPDTLRRLAAARAGDGGKVLSLFVNLDPSEFATPRARDTEITSVLDRAHRDVEGQELERDQRLALRHDLEEAERFLRGELPASDARGLAVYLSSAADIHEAVRLPAPVECEPVIDDSPWIEPLAGLVNGDKLCVALVSRRNARILLGSHERLEEEAQVTDDVHRWHDQGGWSQPRYQRGIEKEITDHLKRVADELFVRLQRRRFDQLLVGVTEELWSHFCDQLHPYVKERVLGRFDVEVEHATPSQVLEAVRPLLAEHERAREAGALERLASRVGAGDRAAAGLEPTLAALNERRVECLLYEERFSAPGGVCPRCGLLTAEGEQCPLDGTPLERRENIVENAVETALAQSADVLVVRDHPGLGPLGHIGALLRF